MNLGLALHITRGVVKAFQKTKTRLNNTISYRYSSTTTISSYDDDKVKTIRTTYVKPHKPLGRKDVQLITFDLQCLPFTYIQKMMVYRGGGGGGGVEFEFEHVEEKMKNGLSLVLEDFFPLAGKMVTDEEGIVRVRYDDDMDGAEFITASAEDIRVEDLIMEGKGNIVGKFSEFFLYNGVFNSEGFYRPLLVVQLTKVKNGFVLSFALNHAVVDGVSMWHFLKAWADKCNGSTQISIELFHDRTKARNTLVKINVPGSERDTNLDLAAGPHGSQSQRVFSFSGSAVDKIKSYVNASQRNAKPFSTFLCLAAHVWRAVTRARKLMPEDLTTSIVCVNSRSRIDPPVPESYFGNMGTDVWATATARVLYTCPPETPASMIRQAIEKHDSNAIDMELKAWERDDPPPRLADFGTNFVLFGSSPRFKLYDLDFGWGKPEMVRSGSNKFDGEVLLLQGKNGDGSIDVDINLEDDEVMKRMEMDKEFLMHC